MTGRYAKADEAAIVAELAATGRYQTPQGAYYSARLRYLTAGDGTEADRALADMIRAVTLTVPDLTDLRIPIRVAAKEISRHRQPPPFDPDPDLIGHVEGGQRIQLAPWQRRWARARWASMAGLLVWGLVSGLEISGTANTSANRPGVVGSLFLSAILGAFVALVVKIVITLASDES